MTRLPFWVFIHVFAHAFWDILVVFGSVLQLHAYLVCTVCAYALIRVLKLIKTAPRLFPLALIHALALIGSLTLLRLQAICVWEMSVCLCYTRVPRLRVPSFTALCVSGVSFGLSSGCFKYWCPYGQWVRLTSLQYAALTHPPINLSSHGTNRPLCEDTSPSERHSHWY